MQRRMLWVGLVALIVVGAIGTVHFVETSASQKGEMSITGKK